MRVVTMVEWYLDASYNRDGCCDLQWLVDLVERASS